ncbi:MAG: GAF domain-containing protein [Deltaproteobacteria bacterium]|nr:GAF domain-containing protein [Deltaproteobacteria bacterium]MBN2846433.1 GAF domain-containing protein [Deltaproteobacteria bacterium]
MFPEESYFYLIPPVAGFFVFITLALITLLRGSTNHTNRLFALICFFGALINIDVALVSFLTDKTLALAIDRLIYLFFVFSIPVYIRFVHRFLGIVGRGWLECAAYVSSLIFLALSQTEYFITGFHFYRFGTIAKAGPAYYAFSFAGAFTALYCLYTLFLEIGNAGENHRRNRIKYVFAGLGLSALLILLNSLPVSGFNIYPLGNFSFIPGMFLAAGVLKYDLLDIDEVIKRGTIYFLLTGTLTLVYVLIIYLFSILFIGYSDVNSLLLSLVLSLLIVLLFNPMNVRIRRFVDNLLYRGRYDYQKTLREISDVMTSALRVSEIIDHLTGSLSSALRVQDAAILLYVSEKESLELYSGKRDPLGRRKTITIEKSLPVAGFFENHREIISKSASERMAPGDQKQGIYDIFRLSRAVILMPMISKGRLTGIIALGEKKSGRLFVQEDIEFLRTIANQSAVALENARSYERIEYINLELEEKVKNRTDDLVKALEEKEKTQKQLIRSESLAAIGQLVAGTAHELNNPIASASSLIETTLETLSEGTGKNEDREEAIEDLTFSLKELTRASNIVKSLLGLSRQTQTYVEPVNMNTVLDDALRVLYNQYKYNDVEIERNYDRNLPDIEGNFANLGQVFINIIKNALQGLPDDGGRIVLTTKDMKKTGTVVIECRDGGRGIPEDVIGDIFKPFFTTKKPGEGTGLGLYIAYEVVKRHDGDIYVRSIVGEGSVFTVELPCKRRESL